MISLNLLPSHPTHAETKYIRQTNSRTCSYLAHNVYKQGKSLLGERPLVVHKLGARRISGFFFAVARQAAFADQT